MFVSCYETYSFRTNFTLTAQILEQLLLLVQHYSHAKNSGIFLPEA